MPPTDERMLAGLTGAFERCMDRRSRARIEVDDPDVPERNHVTLLALDMEEARFVRDSLERAHPRCALLIDDLDADLAVFDAPGGAVSNQ
jgi:hypothetical protein